MGERLRLFVEGEGRLTFEDGKRIRDALDMDVHDHSPENSIDLIWAAGITMVDEGFVKAFFLPTAARVENGELDYKYKSLWGPYWSKPENEDRETRARLGSILHQIGRIYESDFRSEIGSQEEAPHAG